MNAKLVDLNADLGEGFPWDFALLAIVSSTSVCCGAHAGDEATIRATLREAARLGVTVGAHPGYPDREGFGRRNQSMERAEVAALIVAQTTTLKNWSDAPVRFCKPHGALYNQARNDHEIASGVLDAALQLGLPLMGIPTGVLAELARERGVRLIPEGFPDRRYLPDGGLAPRTAPDASVYEPAEVARNVERLVGLGVETLCVHGDDPRALALARLVRDCVERLGWRVGSGTGWR